MSKMNVRGMVEMWAKEPYISDHEDVTKCGLCLRQKIQSEVATEFLQDTSLGDEDLLNRVSNETNRRFKETDLYKRVKSLMNDGHDLRKIAEDLLKEGIEI